MKRFVIRKYVQARDIQDALKREPGEPVDEVYLDEKSEGRPADCIGFVHYGQEEFDFEGRRK